MKIGILTYHKADNYGAVLQAYALMRYLHSLDCNVEFIDYWPSYHQTIYKASTWNREYFKSLGLRRKKRYLLDFPRQFVRRKVRICNFARFRRRYLIIKPMRSRDRYDAVFYGSDIIWHYWTMNNLFSGYDLMYWGDSKIEAKHRFAYAASMGNVIDDERTRALCVGQLTSFDAIAVREKHLMDKLNAWGIMNVRMVVDPTLLLTKDDWNNISSKRMIKDEYVLCYNLENSSVVQSMAELLSTHNNWRVINITGNALAKRQKGYLDMIGPSEFISLFRYAKCIVTSSYHGVVFSITYHKPFIFHSNVQTERITSLLDVSGLAGCFIHNASIESMRFDFDFDLANKKLDLFRQSSINYINDCINRINEDVLRVW